MQGMWFILAAALLTQLLWEVPSIICTVQVVILSVIIPTCWEAAVGLLSTITPPLTPPTPTSTAGHQLATDHHIPPNKSKGAGRDNLFLADTDLSNSYSQLFTFLQFFLQFHLITDSDLCGTNAYVAHLPYGGDSN